jgi:glutamyl-tRNA reductase
VIQAEAIIDHGVQAFLQWRELRSQVPIIKSLAEHSEDIQAAEIALAKKRLAKGEELDAVLKSLAHGLSQKYLHGAYSQIHALSQIKDPEEQSRQTELIREMFGLGKNQRNH